MAESHGGYRRPSSPAPVSGPGAHSQRTDRGPKQHEVTGLPYGEGQAFEQTQSAAPLSAPQGAPGSTPAPMAMPTPLTEASQNGSEPVTAGADAGAGVSAADIGLGRSPDEDLRAKFGPMLPMLRRMADSQYATDAFKAQVRSLEARIT